MNGIHLRSLATLRYEAGLSQRQLAKHAGVSYQNIRRLESGGDASEVPLGVLARISGALHVSMADLLTEASSGPETITAIDRLTLGDARLLRKIATRPTASATLSKTDREVTLPRLVKAGFVVANGDGLRLHPDVSTTLVV